MGDVRKGEPNEGIGSTRRGEEERFPSVINKRERYVRVQVKGNRHRDTGELPLQLDVVTVHRRWDQPSRGNGGRGGRINRRYEKSTIVPHSVEDLSERARRRSILVDLSALGKVGSEY